MIQQDRDIQLGSKERKLVGSSNNSESRLSLNDIVGNRGQGHIIVVGERLANISLMTPTTSPSAAATMSNGALANGHTINNNINNNIGVDNISFGSPTATPTPTTSYGTSGCSSPSIVDQLKPNFVGVRSNNNIDISTSDADNNLNISGTRAISTATCDNLRGNNTMGLLQTVDQRPSSSFLFLKTTGTNNTNSQAIGSNSNPKTGGENGDKQLVMKAMVDCKKLMVSVMERGDQAQKDSKQADIDDHDCENYRAEESCVQESLDDGIELIGEPLPSLETTREQPRGISQDQNQANENYQNPRNNNHLHYIGSGGDDQVADHHIGPTMTTMPAMLLPTVASTTVASDSIKTLAAPVTIITTESASSGRLENHFKSETVQNFSNSFGSQSHFLQLQQQSMPLQIFSSSPIADQSLFSNQIQSSQGNKNDDKHVPIIVEKLPQVTTSSTSACSSALLNSIASTSTASTLTNPYLSQGSFIEQTRPSGFDINGETEPDVAQPDAVIEDIDDDGLDIDLQNFSSVDEEAADARDYFDSMSAAEIPAVENAVNNLANVQTLPSAPPVPIEPTVPPAPPPIISPEELRADLKSQQRSLKSISETIFKRLKKVQLQQTHRSFVRQMKTFVDGQQRLASITCQTFDIDPALNPATALPYKMVRNEIAMIKGILPNLSPSISWPPPQPTNFSAPGSIQQFVSMPQQIVKNNNNTIAVSQRNFVSPQKSATLSSLPTNFSVAGLNSQPRIDGVQQQMQSISAYQPATLSTLQQHQHLQSQSSIVPASYITTAVPPTASSGITATAIQVPYEAFRECINNEGNLQQVRNMQQHLQQKQQQQIALFAQTVATKHPVATRLISNENRERLLSTLDTLGCNLRHMETKYDSDATESSSGPESDDDMELLSLVDKAAAASVMGGGFGSGLDGASGSVGALDDMSVVGTFHPGELQSSLAGLVNNSLANTPTIALAASSSNLASTEKEYIPV